MELFMSQEVIFKLFLVMSSLISGFAIFLSIYALYKQTNINRATTRLASDQHQLEKNQDELLEELSQLHHLQQKLDVLRDHSEKLDHLAEGVGILAEKMSASDSRLSRVEVRDSQVGSYQQAAKLVELGAQKEEVAQTCGLSRAEADLVALVNRHQSLKSKLNQQDDSDNEDQSQSL